MPRFEESGECEWVVYKLCTPPIPLTGLKPLRLVGIVPVAGLAQGIGQLVAVRVPAGTELPVGTGPARGIVRAGVPAGTDRVRGIGRPWAGRGTGPAGIGRPWAGRGIGRFGAGPSCGCS